MALQGDLDSFALPDVLRLLAGTGKTGRLGVTAAPGTGEVWLLDGSLVGGSVSSAPHATSPSDLVFELLRFDGGAFVFDDGEQLVGAGDHAPVEDAIVDAEALLAEWTEIETVVPSVGHWVTLAAELPGDEVTVSAADWRLLALLAPGSTVRTLGDRLEVTDLVASRQVKALVEAGLVDLAEEPPAGAPIAAEDRTPVLDEVPTDELDEDDDADDFGEAGELDEVDAIDLGGATPIARDDLAILSAEDGPVVLETSDDALLPEPLPGEGTSFVGEVDGLGSVDGRAVEVPEAVVADEPEAAAASFVADPAPTMAEPATGGWSAPGYDDLPAPPAPPADDWAPAPVEPGGWGELQEHPGGWGEAELAALAEATDESTDGDEELPPPPPAAEQDDRGSLLKFLSSVKP